MIATKHATHVADLMHAIPEYIDQHQTRLKRVNIYNTNNWNTCTTM